MDLIILWAGAGAPPVFCPSKVFTRIIMSLMILADFNPTMFLTR
jgi:hypothetical protein